ncbi:uncharacterized protein [Magallana gigas]|uniref:uncharacterized protein isoform X2 n=1 Tax=Magallana gigas TaxID=29159 RepID=UPI00333F0733
MSLSKSQYGSTVETTNLARLARIILGPCTDVLQDVLKKNIDPSVLPGKFKTFLANNKKSPFNKEQETIVYTGKYSNFDITLLCALLRNICTFKPHLNNWGNVPNPGDRSESANIERIRLLRNKYQGHHSSISISSSDFNQEWQAIFDTVKELELHIGTCTVYQEEVKNITQCCMDPEQETKYIEKLLDLNKKLDDISELFDREVSRWKEDDKVFLETHNFPAMFNRVVDKTYVTFVGVPGSGKSVTARHIALKLQEEGYYILPIKNISDIETQCIPDILQVFVIDDVVGVFGFDESKFNELCKYESIIKKPEMKETKVIMTCREVVYRNEYLTNTFLSESANVVKLHSDENLLTEEDKCNMLTMYDLDKQLLSSIDLSLTSKMFPFLCKLYKKEFRNYGTSFFMSPYPCILDEMDKMKRQNKIQYASLVLLMFNDSKLSESILDDDRSSNRSSSFEAKKISVLNRCKVDRETNSFRFIDALSDMEGTYTNKFDSEYTFIHDSMFEIVACHFGRQFPELMIQYMSSDYFANYIKVNGNESENRISEKVESTKRKASGLCINISESHHQMLAERLFRDVENGEMLVFENEALKHPSVLQTFIDVITRKSYRELYSIFLSEGFCLFFRSQMPNENETLGETFKRLQISSLLYNRERFRAISWVIYRSHNQILQYIIDRILTENGNVNDLFQNSYNKDGKERMSYDIVDVERGAVMTARDSDIESDIEKVTVEQFRLLCLGCYSADNTTVKILLKHMDIKNIIKTFFSLQFATTENEPLLIVCKYGYDKIARELLQASANINLFWELSRPLVVACDNGHLNVVKVLINTGANVNGIHNSETPLTVACKAGHVNVVEELIKAGADVNLGDGDDTPLTAACDYGNLNVVKVLINTGANVNDIHNSATPLTVACKTGHVNVVEELIKAGADVNLGDGDETPLTSACDNGDLNVVKVLINTGANVNDIHKSETPLTVACKAGHANVVDELIKAGADIYLAGEEKTPLMIAFDHGHSHIIELLVKAGSEAIHKGGHETSLTIACFKGHLEEVEKIIQAGADVNLRNGVLTPLVAACYMGHLRVVKEMIKAGADVNLLDGDVTPLTAACLGGLSSVVEELINTGACVNSKDKHTIPIMVSCSSGNVKLTKVLVKAGADVNIKHEGKTPLTVACSAGFTSVAEELINAGADVNLKGDGKTPLIIACGDGNLFFVQMILNTGADVNLGDGNDTPLTAACDNGNLNVINELIKAGANVDLKGEGKTSLIIACRDGNLFLVQRI